MGKDPGAHFGPWALTLSGDCALGEVIQTTLVVQEAASSRA